MEQFVDRLLWFLLGCFVGYVLHIIVQKLDAIQTEVHEVHGDTSHSNPEKDESGKAFLDFRSIALGFIVLLTAYAAFASQKASNDVQDTQDQIIRVTSCTKQTLSKTIEALNQRTTFTQAQTEANVDLQRAQLELLQIGFTDPPASKKEGKQALKKYFDALTDFVTLAGQSQQKAKFYPYPTTNELAACLVTPK